ncbi:MBL fold metallo-hydrolase RNA specificity domain-containing protein [candidate division KSB1 bacterium]
MKVTFHGACREVTGSMHLLDANNSRIMLDCGLFQGKRSESREKNKSLPFNPDTITNVLLSHAHIDHSGRLPLLSAKDFSGRVITTRPTHDACGLMLPDSGHIQESDADYLNYKAARSFLRDQKQAAANKRKLHNRQIDEIKKLLKGKRDDLRRDKIREVISRHNLTKVEPLYTIKDAEEILEQFEGHPYNETVEVGDKIFCTFYDAGHILGSAIMILDIYENGKHTSVGFSGDLGRFNEPILRDPTLVFPEKHHELDLLLLETTYGNRDHESIDDSIDILASVVKRTIERGGTVVIPSFAMERAQVLIYMLHLLFNQGKLPTIPVYVDSPLTVNLTKVFGSHPECYDSETHHDFLENGENPFSFKRLKYVNSVAESMALMRETSPHIVISASGMCEAGRILHHLRYKIHDSRNTILFSGYQAQNTLGRRIIELDEKRKSKGGKEPRIRFMNKEYPLRAEVAKIDGFSAHADRSELIRFLNESNLNIKKIALVHGETDAVNSFSSQLNELNYDVVTPSPGETVELGN